MTVGTSQSMYDRVLFNRQSIRIRSFVLGISNELISFATVDAKF
jgi:hypothetical protein